MKKIIILEGIATTGKTTIINNLRQALSDDQISFILEDETLMPLIDNKSEVVAKNHLENLINNIYNSNKNMFVFERFIFTHIFRTSQNYADFKKIEKRLVKEFETHLFLLVIKNNLVEENIVNTSILRGTNWSKGKKGTLSERLEYYRQQQDFLIGLSENSMIENTIIDTGEKDWATYYQIILKYLQS